MIVLSESTRRQVSSALDSGVNTAILPLGATEQHGAALPFGTDTIIAELVARNLAERLNALLLPAMPFGVSLEHVATAGTITVSADTLIRVVRETCESLITNGITRIVLLVAHFG